MSAACCRDSAEDACNTRFAASGCRTQRKQTCKWCYSILESFIWFPVSLGNLTENVVNFVGVRCKIVSDEIFEIERMEEKTATTTTEIALTSTLSLMYVVHGESWDFFFYFLNSASLMLQDKTQNLFEGNPYKLKHSNIFIKLSDYRSTPSTILEKVNFFQRYLIIHRVRREYPIWLTPRTFSTKI